MDTSGRSDREEVDGAEDRDERERKRYKEDTMIRDYFAMACEICPFQFGTFLEARGHYRKAHQKAGYLACCNKRFFYRGGLIDHINVHLNPEKFKYVWRGGDLGAPKTGTLITKSYFNYMFASFTGVKSVRKPMAINSRCPITWS